MSYFSKKLKELRLFKDLLQRDVAEDLGIPLTTYNTYERGRTEPTYDFLMQIADYYNITIDELIGYKPKSKAEEAQDNDITELIKNYKRLTERQKRHIRINIYNLLDETEKLEKEISK